MASPSLLAQSDAVYIGGKVSDEWCSRIYQQQSSWLAALDRDPASLQQWLDQQRSPLLGFYFESLLVFWLSHMPGVRLLARNVVIGQPGLRIGEFDFVFEDLELDQCFHWEVSVKFYLRYGAQEFRWLGPNPKDSLQRKLNKVFNQQLLLSEKVQAQRTLQQLIHTTELYSKAFIKGLE